MAWKITLGDRSGYLGELTPELLARVARESTELGWRGVLYFPKADPAAFRALVREVAAEWGVEAPDVPLDTTGFIDFQDAALEDVEDGDLPKSGTEGSPSTDETTTGTSSTSTEQGDGDPT